jgi:hypothetical protein
MSGVVGFLYPVAKTRRRRRSKLARPYMDRLISLRRWTFPSTGPLLHLCSRAALTAASPLQGCLAKEASGV